MKPNTDAIAVVNSCKGNDIDVTVLDQAKSQRLDGALVEMEIKGDGTSQWALGRLGMVAMRNPYHENPSMSAVIAHNGRIEYLSEAADVCSSTIKLISCVDQETMGIGPRATPPSSATEVFRVGRNGLDKYRPEKEDYAVVGHLSGYESVPISVINKGFQAQENGGWGEAKHAAYFGRNGSGKTVKAAMDLACQLAACPAMGCLIPDTAGDLSRKGTHDKGDFKFDMFELLEASGRSYSILNIDNVALTSVEVFKHRFQPLLLKRFSTNGDKSKDLVDYVAEELFGDKKTFEIKDVTDDRLLSAVGEAVTAVFNSGRNKSDKQNIWEDILNRPGRKDSFLKSFRRDVASVFEGDQKIDLLLKRFLRGGEIIVIKMFGISASDQRCIMQEIFEQTTREAEKAFHASGSTVNAMVVLDEGPRWVPQDRKKQDDVSTVIIDAFNTTRKYGLGWTIISQRITAISKDVLAQCHTIWYGKGLGVGADADHIKQELGNEGYEEYQAMQLLGGYPWIGIGDTINLGAGNHHVSLSPFGGDANQKIIEANPHIWTEKLSNF
jgi:hypothetical protein